MAVEIELKAWVEDPEALGIRVSGMAEFAGSFEKEDLYWYPQGPLASIASPSGVRVRKTGWTGGDGLSHGSTLVTYKSKELREGLEVNDELEFGVDSPEVFGEFLGRLGFKPGIAKKKRGRCWKQGDLTAEIAEVEGLGWFIELEILADNSRPETVAEARRRLLDFLRKAGAGEARIEPRYYTEMLREKREREACNPALSSPGEAGKTGQTAPGS